MLLCRVPSRNEQGFRHTKVDIVFSLSAQSSLSELMAQLAGSCVTCFTDCPLKKVVGGCLFFEMASAVLGQPPSAQVNSLVFLLRSLKA
jgi:hypothetical protein